MAFDQFPTEEQGTKPAPAQKKTSAFAAFPTEQPAQVAPSPTVASSSLFADAPTEQSLASETLPLSPAEEIQQFLFRGAKGLTGTLGRGLKGVGTLAMMTEPEGYTGGPGPLYKAGSYLQSLGQMEDKGQGDNWLNYDFPQAFGQGVGYLGVGLAGGPATVGTLGALDQGQSMYDDAIANGATEEQAKQAFLAGNVIGGAEALPMWYFLDKINKFSGGQWVNTLKGLGAATPSVLKEAVKGFLLEGGTEAAQQLAENWVAKDLVKYDPNRTLDENLWDSFKTGGAIGSLFAGGIGALNHAKAKEQQEEFDRQYRMREQSGDPINDIAGPFSSVSDVVDLGAQKAGIEDELQQSGREHIATATGVPDDFVSHSRQEQNTNFPGQESFDAYLAGSPIDLQIEKAISDGREHMTVREALTKTPVVVEKGTAYQDQIDVVESSIALEKKFQEQWTENGVPENAQARIDSRKNIERLENTLKQLKLKQSFSKIWLRHIKNYVAAFNLKFSNAKFVISDRQSGLGKVLDKRSPNALGQIATFDKINLGNGPERVYHISINTDELSTYRYEEVQQKKNWYSTPEMKQARGELFEVLNHELGHHMIFQHLQEVLDKAALGDQKSAEIYMAVRRDYDTWLKMMRRGQFGDYLDNAGIPSQHPANYEQLQGEYNSDIPKESKTSGKNRNYLFSFDEFFAQQMARMATQGKLADPALTKFFQPLLAQYKAAFEKFPQYAKNEYGGNFENFIKRQSLVIRRQDAVESAKSNGPQTLFDAIKGLKGFNPENFKGLREGLDNWSKFKDVGYNILQALRLNPHIEGLAKYVNFTRQWAAYTRTIAARAVETLGKWRKLGKMKSNQVVDILFKETAEGRLLQQEELAKLLPNLDQQEVYAQIRRDLNWVLDEMKQESIGQAYKNFADNDLQREAALKEIEDEFGKMKAKGYFPYIRFGKWINTIRAAENSVIDGVKYKKGELVAYEAYESKRERDKAANAFRAKYKGSALISPSIQKDSSFVVQGLPAAMLRTMKERIPNLTEEQREAIDAALKDLAPYRGLKAQFLRRRGIAGFSLDGMRSYAQYMRMAAGHLARVKYSEPLQNSINQVNGDVKVLSLLGRDSTKRQMIANYMSNHFDYIMNPVSELTGLRSAIFLWFLGYNIKSAVVNLTQVPMVTLPYLSARYGDLQAVRALAMANGAATSIYRDRTKWLTGSPRRQAVLQMIEQGKKEGWLDQALATELAIAASEGNVDRALPVAGVKRTLFKLSEWGAKPFSVAEKINRNITAIAAFQLEMERSGSYQTAYNAARDAVESTQYENSRWNRPRFMRGKLGTLFMFKNYVQNTMFNFMHDPAGARMLVMFALFGGLLGEPFAKNLADLGDWGLTKLREILGSKDPKFDTEKELRDTLEEIHMNPDLVLHGLSRDSFGLPVLSQMMGLPLPEFDLSGSVSMGEPMFSLSNFTGQPDANGIIANGAMQATGAGGAIFNNALQGIYSGEVDGWKRTERFLPVFMKNVSKAARLAARGKEADARGDVIADFDPFDPKEAIELIGQSVGFTPTELSQGWEARKAAQEAVQYYRARMEVLLKQHDWAFEQEDREAAADVRKEIAKYNETVPYPEMKITRDAIAESLKSYLTARVKAAQGIEAQQKYMRLRQAVESAYGPQGSVGIEHSSGLDAAQQPIASN